MKNRLFLTAAVIATAFSFSSAVAQVQTPGAPEDNGLRPSSATIYINSQATVFDMINNANTESLGVSIAANGNVIVGWEDDAADSSLTPLQDLEAVWTLFDATGTWLTPDTGMNSLQFASAGWVTNKFLSYFRANGSAVYGGTSWGPKIKANLFGDGIGMGATSFYLGEEVTEFAPWQDLTMGDFSSVQLLGNDGAPKRILPGITSAYATSDAGNIRIGDWDYLANSNIVIVSESRQAQDLVTLYGGDIAANHAVFRILDVSNQVIKAETLVSETPVKSEMWHGVGVTKNGFAVRFAGPTGATVRMFDNSGTATSTNIDLAAATGFPLAGQGGRGDGTGFHGNGNNAYVHVATGTDQTDFLPKVWVTVLDTNGTVRYSKSVADDLTLGSVGRADAAIDPDGSVIVVFAGKVDSSYPNTLVMGRRFDPAGQPVGGTFYVSEKELPDPATGTAAGPRIAWRNKQVAIVWESQNDTGTYDPTTGGLATVVALRYFSTFNPGTIESAGLTRIVPDKPVIVPEANALGNWEPYTSVLGDNTFLIEANTFATNDLANQRYVIYFQPAAGGQGKLGDSFFSDDGQPFRDQINLSRQNGNPGRVAGDRRPGATTILSAAEVSLGQIEAFKSATRTADPFRWDRNPIYGGGDASARYVCVQPFTLNPTTLLQTPLTNAFDAVYGGYSTAQIPTSNQQVTRTGGTVACLDNGNFVVVIHDRTGFLSSGADNVTTAAIITPTGTVVKGPWLVEPQDIWDNVAAYKGGFAIRVHQYLFFYDNAGNLKGQTNITSSGRSFNTDRGDATRIAAHINSPYVYLCGSPPGAQLVSLAVADSRNQSWIAVADVSEPAFVASTDRAALAVDALDRIVCVWESRPTGYVQPQTAGRVMKFDSATTNFAALTPSFWAFVNVNPTNNIRTYRMNASMTTRQICIAAKGEINLQNKPELGPDSPTEVNFFTVFTHPAPANDPTLPVGGGAKFTRFQVVPGTPAKLHLEWTGGGILQLSIDLQSGQWQDVTGATSPYDLPIEGPQRFARIKQ